MAAFSELIGNSDRHFENISLLIREDGEFQGIAPADDSLPGVTPRSAAAEQFWRAAQEEGLAVPVSPAMQEQAGRTLARARELVGPLLPR